MYNYREELKQNILDAITSGEYTSNEYDELYDSMWIDDSITGNGSGSYTFDREQAKQYVLDNMTLAVEAFKEFDCTDKFTQNLIDNDYESIDVTIRCYLLGECLQEVTESIDFSVND